MTTARPEPAPRPHPRPASGPDQRLSVWPTAQRDARSQRRGRYLPASTAHPAKMLPAIAATAITRYTQPGDLVADPMCGIGTTLAEALYLGRDALGVEFEGRWARIAAANIDWARRHGRVVITTVPPGRSRTRAAARISPNPASRSSRRRLARLAGSVP